MPSIMLQGHDSCPHLPNLRSLDGPFDLDKPAFRTMLLQGCAKIWKEMQCMPAQASRTTLQRIIQPSCIYVNTAKEDSDSLNSEWWWWRMKNRLQNLPVSSRFFSIRDTAFMMSRPLRRSGIPDLNTSSLTCVAKNCGWHSLYACAGAGL